LEEVVATIWSVGRLRVEVSTVVSMGEVVSRLDCELVGEEKEVALSATSMGPVTTGEVVR
jgi:hypothetical protein